MLDRHGVLTREAVVAEGIEGGFGPIYAVLKALEDVGRIRRGYFVVGLGATQFALPEAVERLRSSRSDLSDASDPSDRCDTAGATLLASCDPANPYGAALPWPERSDARGPARAVGSYVTLRNGEPVFWFSRSEGRMVVFMDDASALAAGADALCEAVAAGRIEPFVLARIGDGPAATHPAAQVLTAHGLAASSRGLVVRRASLRGR
jgi:ATP-dependent Lhr-like helicase